MTFENDNENDDETNENIEDYIENNNENQEVVLIPKDYFLNRIYNYA